GTALLCGVIKTSPADHALFSGRRAVRVNATVPYVAVHVIKPPCVWCFLAHRVGCVIGIAVVPSVFAKPIRAVHKRACRPGSGSEPIFAPCSRRQPVYMTGFLLLGRFRQFLAECDRVVRRYAMHRMIWSDAVVLVDLRRILARDLFVLGLRDLVDTDVEWL